MFFHVIKGLQAGAVLTVEPNTNFVVANDMQADIYLRQNNEKNCSFNFQYTDNSLSLSEIIGELSNSYTGEILTDNTQYPLPIFINLNDDMVIAISHNDIETLDHSRIKGHVPEDKLAVNFLNDILNEEHSTSKKPKEHLWQQKISSQAMRIQHKLFPIIISWIHSTQEFWQKLRQKFGKIIYVAIVILVVILMTILLVIHQFNQQEKIENVANQRFDIRHRIETTLIELPTQFSNIKLNKAANDFIISGILENQNYVLQLHDNLKEFNDRISYKIYIFNNIKNDIIDIVKNNHIIHPQITYKSATGISIYGITDNLDNISNAEIEISNKFGNIGQLDVSGIILTKVIDDFLARLALYFKEQLTIERNDAIGQIILTGYFSQPQLHQIDSEVSQFRSQHQNIDIILNTQDIIKAIPFKIKEIYTGSPGWLIADNQLKIYTGGNYKGITLLDISQNELVLKGKFQFSVSMTELMEMNATNTDSQPTKSDVCDRECILQQEMQTESTAIAKEQRQILQLKHILQITAESSIKQDLNDSIKNMTEDLITRQHEYESSGVNQP